MLHVDDAPSWNDLHARFEVKRIDHQVAYSLDGMSPSMAESYFSRLCRAEMGYHLQFAGLYLLKFSQEAAWREDYHRVPNGEQVQWIVKLALGRKKSVDFCAGCGTRVRPSQLMA